MKHTIVLTAQLPSPALEILSQECDVVVHISETERTEAEMVHMFAEADGAITLSSDPVTRNVLASNPNLRIVANYGFGTDNVDLDAARELGIRVTNTPGILGQVTEEAQREMARIAVMNVLIFFRTGEPLNTVV